MFGKNPKNINFTKEKHTFSRNRRCQKRQKSTQMCRAIRRFLEHRCWHDFGEVLGGFWDLKILDFRTFFDVFSKHFSSNVLDSQKIEKNCPTREHTSSFWVGPAECAASGGEKKRGGQGLRCSRCRKQAECRRVMGRSWSSGPARCTTFGGRRIEAVHFAPYLYGGRSPPYNFSAKRTASIIPVDSSKASSQWGKQPPSIGMNLIPMARGLGMKFIPMTNKGLDLSSDMISKLFLLVCTGEAGVCPFA